MQEILKMVIEPSNTLNNWRIYWLPVLGTPETMNKPVSLDPKPFREAITTLKTHDSLRDKNIGTSSGEICLFVNSGATPRDMKFIHETIQHAYFIHLKSELPKWLPTTTTKVKAIRAGS